MEKQKPTILTKHSKQLLHNTLRHTESHNKCVEEEEMWRRKVQVDISKRSRRKTSPMPMSSRDRSRSPDAKRKKPSFHFTRLLQEYEEQCGDRWGHSGYKELYPEEFQATSPLSSTSSSSESSDESTLKRKESQKKDKKLSRRNKRKKAEKDVKVRKKRNKKKTEYVWVEKSTS